MENIMCLITGGLTPVILVIGLPAAASPGSVVRTSDSITIPSGGHAFNIASGRIGPLDDLDEVNDAKRQPDKTQTEI
jgi:hypothetical protein